MKRNKKKGFTLVELIAVIAILAILAAVVVPKISSYTTQATNSAKKANARSVLNAIEVYNAQATTAIPVASTMDQITGDAALNSLALQDVGSADDDLIATVKKVVTANKGISGSTTVTTVQGLVD